MMRIRKACPDDATGIGSVHVAVWKSAYRGLIPSTVLDNQNESARTAFWEQFLIEKDWPVYVAETEREIVGFASCLACRDKDKASEQVFELAAIYLLNKVGRQGVGSALLSQCSQYGVSHEFDSMTLWVLEKNQIACSFYEKHGFRKDGLRKYYDDLDAFEVRMHTNLPIAG